MASPICLVVRPARRGHKKKTGLSPGLLACSPFVRLQGYDQCYCTARKNIAELVLGTVYGEVAPGTAVQVAPAPKVALCCKADPVKVMVSAPD